MFFHTKRFRPFFTFVFLMSYAGVFLTLLLGGALGEWSSIQGE
jgi:hypothetical protein